MVIGISGKMGSGKTTLANALKEHFGEQAVKLKFADPLYGATTAVQQYLNIPVEKDRVLLQTIGYHYREKFGKDFWAKRVVEDINLINYNGNFIIIIDDLRFPEEFDALNKMGALLIRLESPRDIRAERVGSGLFLNESHASETALDGEGRFHLTIDSSLCTPYETFKIVLESMGHNVL